MTNRNFCHPKRKSWEKKMGSIRKTGCFQFVSFRTENESNSSISIGGD
ncbi:hypothetical protein NXV33_22435 [Bacteroides thetaiotaomicron]|nr:hypothetical protein [Bacteroides thetaiotaomicron]